MAAQAQSASEMSAAYPMVMKFRLREAFQHRFEGLSPHLKRIAQYALGDSQPIRVADGGGDGP